MKKWILTVLFSITAIILYGVYIYKDTMNGKLHGEEKAVSIAKKEVGLVKITNTDYYHGMSSYNVFEGTDKKGEKWIVWVPEKKKEKVIARRKSDGISQDKALQIFLKDKKPKEILKVKLGAEKDVPLWEITYIDQENRYSYYYLDFKDGKFEGYYSI
jgi:uncharacterized protein YpmB